MLLQIFQEFEAFVMWQFNRKIKIFRIDGETALGKLFDNRGRRRFLGLPATQDLGTALLHAVAQRDISLNCLAAPSTRAPPSRKQSLHQPRKQSYLLCHTQQRKPFGGIGSLRILDSISATKLPSIATTNRQFACS